MELKYYLPDPTGNVTVLAEGDVPAQNRAAVAAQLMNMEPTAEQVGFIVFKSNATAPETATATDPATAPDITLNMAGGEFCGNATMSAGVLVAMKRGIKVGDECDIGVLSSGVSTIRKVHVKAIEEDLYRADVNMPRPKSITTKKLSFEGEDFELPVVDFGGITHIVIDVENNNIFKDEHAEESAEKAVMEWCDKLHAECLGLMLYEPGAGKLTPLVYVPEAGTLVWESSCASGTTAVGVYAAHTRNSQVNLDITEPGGVLRICASPNGEPVLTGHVRLAGD